MKTVDIQKMLKYSRSKHLIECMKYVRIEGQCHFLTLAQGRVHTKIQTVFSQKLPCLSEPFIYESFQLQGNKKNK